MKRLIRKLRISIEFVQETCTANQMTWHQITFKNHEPTIKTQFPIISCVFFLFVLLRSPFFHCFYFIHLALWNYISIFLSLLIVECIRFKHIIWINRCFRIFLSSAAHLFSPLHFPILFISPSASLCHSLSLLEYARKMEKEKSYSYLCSPCVLRFLPSSVTPSPLLLLYFLSPFSFHSIRLWLFCLYCLDCLVCSA